MVKLSKIRDILGGRSNNREVLGVNRRLLDDSEAPSKSSRHFYFVVVVVSKYHRSRSLNSYRQCHC